MSIRRPDLIEIGASMKKRFRATTGVIAGLSLFLSACAAGSVRAPSPVPGAVHKETVVTTRASGTFEVKLDPQATYNNEKDALSGSFALQHSGTMTRGAPQLIITVVPDSGTDQLVGITGTMAIEIADGKHSYTFEYTPGTAVVLD